MSDIKKIICDKFKEWQELPIIGDFLKPSKKISVVKMSGIIAESGFRGKGISFSKFDDVLEKAFDKSGLEAVALIINSPGGSPAQSMLIGDKIRKLSEEKKVPVYAFVEDVAASGGYWLACAADEIYALPVSIVGSIGVISTGFGLEDFIEKHNIKRRVYTAGTQKSFLDIFSEEKEEDIKRLKVSLNSIHDEFKGWVRSRRGDRIKGTDEDLFEGQFWVAREIAETGLIDGYGNYHEILKEKFGKEIKLVDISPKKSMFSFGGGDVSIVNKDIQIENFAYALVEKVEEKSIYSRYGF